MSAVSLGNHSTEEGWLTGRPFSAEYVNSCSHLLF